jgi:hypothetical protein
MENSFAGMLKMELFTYSIVCINTKEFTVLVPMSPIGGEPIFDFYNEGIYARYTD